MVARLWWKEARLFWPIAAFLVLVAELAQVLTVYYFESEARTGLLALMAFGWTYLYAFAVAAASLAGERENGTLWLLDALPAGRGPVWGAKISFALGSTLALGLLLVALSSLSTQTWDMLRPRNATITTGVLVLLQVLGWGFFWSAICGHALTAAVLAVCSMGLTMSLFETGLNYRLDADSRWLTQALLTAATMGASAFFFIQFGPPRRSLVKGRNIARERVVESYEEARRNSRRMSPAWPRAAWSLAWQTAREIGWLWWRLALISLFVPVILSVWSRSRLVGDPTFLAFFNVGASILAGVNMFGTEYGSRTRRFLAHHGVRPGIVWIVKTSLWLAALAVIWLPATFVWLIMDVRIPSQGIATVLIACLSLLLGSTVLGQLCGMIFPRGITAGLIALVLLIAVLILVGPLFGMQLMPAWVMLGIPIVIMAVSLAWSGEWLLDRPGARRWVKLGLFLCAGFGLLFAGYTYDRAELVPVLDPVAEARLFTFTTAPRQTAEGNDARELYAEALKVAERGPQENQGSIARQVIEKGWNVTNDIDAAYLRDNPAALDLVRKASSLPAMTLVNLDRATIFSGVEPVAVVPTWFTGLLALSVADHQAKGDLPGAWQELMVMFRMARQWSGAVPLQAAHSGLGLEREALSLAMLWAADSRQTAKSLHQALDSYQKLPPMPSAAETVRAEARITRNALDLPRSELVEKFLELRSEPHKPSLMNKLWVDVATTPWELARVRKLFSVFFASKIVEAQSTPWEMIVRFPTHNGWSGLQYKTDSRIVFVPAHELEELLESTPLARMLMPSFEHLIGYWNRNEVGRRALVQILALRSWQVKHGGRLPEKLADLVPAELEQLPDDPYKANNAFGYVRSDGQLLLPLGDLEPVGPGTTSAKLRPTENYRLLYSVGPNLQDDRASSNDSSVYNKGDIIFPLKDGK